MKPSSRRGARSVCWPARCFQKECGECRDTSTPAVGGFTILLRFQKDPVFGYGGAEKRVGCVVSVPLLQHADGFEDDGIPRNHRPVVAAEALGCCAAKAGSSL